MIRLCFLFLILFTAIPAYSDSLPFEVLKCEYKTGYMAEFKENITVEEIKEPMVIYFSNIDLSKNSAVLTGNRGSADVHLFKTHQGLTFIEFTSSLVRNINITTVFLYDGNKYPSVTSRHITMGGIAIPSQRYGYCYKVKAVNE